MDPSSEQHQEMPAAHSLDMLVCSKSQQDQRKPRPQPEQALKCPRCDSTNTKFCYYNNYSLSQPRYFCKACRRYWTKGGTLRNVPVGGGCRKNKRSSSSSSASSKRSQDQPLTPNSNSNNNPLLPSLAYDSNDLTLAFARLQQRQSCGQLGFDDHHDHHLSILGNPTSNHSDILGNTSAAAAAPGLFDALRTGFLETHNNNFQNLYYGFGNGNNNNNLGDQVEDGGGVGGDPMGLHNPYDHQEMTNATTTAVTVTTMKQELCNARDQSETNRVLWGFPWQLNGDVNMGSGECDAGRESWNGLASSWHGLLHSPLV